LISILMVTNNFKFDSNLLEALKKDYKVYVAKEGWEAQDMMEHFQIDVFVVASDDHLEYNMENFFAHLESTRSPATPVILITRKPSDLVQHRADDKGWYLVRYPLDVEQFLNCVKNSAFIANLLDERSLILERSGGDRIFMLKDVFAIERGEGKSVFVHYIDPDDGRNLKERFIHKRSMADFLGDYKIEKQFAQAQQSWLINRSFVLEIDSVGYELHLKNGRIIPTSKNYINNFRRKSKEVD